MKLSRIFCSLAVMAAFTFVQYSSVTAAEVPSLTMEGYDRISEDAKTILAFTVGNISEDTINYFNDCGGKVVFRDGLLDNIEAGHDLNNVYGAYDPVSHLIRVRTDGAAAIYPYLAETVVVHEMGHFLYMNVVPLLDPEDKDIIHAEYEKWENYSINYANENEAFAEFFLRTKQGNADDLSDDIKYVLDKTESLCGKLHRYYEDNGRLFKIGPGASINDLAQN